MISLKLLQLEESRSYIQMLKLSTHLKNRVRMLSAGVTRLDFLNPNNFICVLSGVYSSRWLQSKGYLNIELSSNKDYVSSAWK